MSKLKQFVYEDNNRKIYYLAEKEYNNFSVVLEQIWHREDEPAYIRYYKDGNIKYEDYWVNGKKHRENGPASVYYNDDGSIRSEVYYIDDKKYTKQEYDNEMRRRNTKIGKELYE